MRFGIVIILNAALAHAAWAQDVSPQDLVLQANEQLRAGQYDEAIEKYKQAAELLPDAAELAYNRAIGHYRKGDFENATEQFITSLKTRDPELEAKAKFNLGNCAYAAALAKKDNIPEAVEDLKSAILHYKDAIESNPDDKDARINIEMAQLLMKDLLDKQKQQQEEQQNQDQNQDEKQDQEKQDDQGEDQQQEQSSEQEDQEQSGDQQEQQEGEDQQQQNEQQQGQEQSGEGREQEQQQSQAAEQQQQESQKGQERKMTREEAERLLQMIRDKEMQRRRNLAQRIRAKHAPVDKDW